MLTTLELAHPPLPAINCNSSGQTADPTPPVGSTVGPTPLAQVWASQPGSCEPGSAVPITRFSFYAGFLWLVPYEF